MQIHPRESVIMAEDFEAMIKWYNEVLAMKITFKVTEEYNYCNLENENGIKTRYAHLSELGVGKGEEVSRGQEIGRVGDSGRATGPHLHLEMERSGRMLNPLKAGVRL